MLAEDMLLELNVRLTKNSDYSFLQPSSTRLQIHSFRRLYERITHAFDTIHISDLVGNEQRLRRIHKFAEVGAN